MAAQDYGDLSDYLVNGDNYTRVDPSGSVLVIAGQYGEPPLVPDVARDTYRPIGGDSATCSVGNCALFAHDSYTGAFVILEIAGFDQTEENCLCALAGEFLSTNTADCQAKLQQFVDNSDGQILFDVIPQWYLQELGILDQEFTATVLFDYWFVGCYGDLLTIPNLPTPITATPPPPSGCTSYSFWGKGCRV